MSTFAAVGSVFPSEEGGHGFNTSLRDQWGGITKQQKENHSQRKRPYTYIWKLNSPHSSCVQGRWGVQHKKLDHPEDGGDQVQGDFSESAVKL